VKSRPLFGLAGVIVKESTSNAARVGWGVGLGVGLGWGAGAGGVAGDGGGVAGGGGGTGAPGCVTDRHAFVTPAMQGCQSGAPSFA
jgi:hypothetical protein